MITVNNLTKEFRIPHEKTKTLFHRLISIFRYAYEFERLYALQDITFHVNTGEFVGIIGRNGSGKTTLLRVLAGIYRPSSGSYNIEADISPFLDIGVGFQGDFSCRDNIYINSALLGFSRREIDDRYQQILKFAELERFSDAKLENLSTGMRVRLAFAIAIMSDAPVLLVDEVIAVGDKIFQRKCNDVFSNYKKSGKTILFVTHDMSAIRQYCDRVLIIDEGKILFDGFPNDGIMFYEKNILKLA